MIALALLMLLQGQVPAPQVEASVDHDRIQVGEELTLRVRAISRSAAPLQVTLPSLNGVSLVGRTEHTEVSLIGPEATRVTTVEYRLRGLRPGRWQLGPATIIQNGQHTATDPVIVQVVPGAAAAAAALNPRVRRLLQSASPPTGPPHVALQLVLSSDSVRIGEQVDLLTIAWFPRSVRQELRRPPLLQPPTMDGVWTYPQPTPFGVVDSRQAGGTTYDLFVSHQVVFPLVPGWHQTTDAVLKYSLPVALQFFSQEERYSVTAKPVSLRASALPATGQPPGFSGAAASTLLLNRTVEPPSVHAGETATLELTLTGYGNVALWPSPVVQWPEGVRVYTDRVSEEIAVRDGLVGGRKTFRYLLVPDSAGPVPLPPVEYPYFETASDRYRVASVPGAALPVARSGEAAASRVEPPPLIGTAAPTPAWRIVHGIPIWGWAILLLAPVIGWAAPRFRQRRVVSRGTPQPPGGDERAFDQTLARLVPDAAVRSGPGLTRALRAAGLDPAVAERAAQIRDELMAQRYGPPGAPAGQRSAELQSELRDITAHLSRLRRKAITAVALFLALGVGRLHSQTPDPAQLYRTGAFRAAVEGFSRDATAHPASMAAWYNLGAAEYRLGNEGAAAAYWVRAHRLAPRNEVISRALRLVPPPDPESLTLTRVAPLTPEELLIGGAVLWILGWAGLLLRRRPRTGWAAVAALGLVAGCAAGALAHWYDQPLALVANDVPARVSPHQRAPQQQPLAGGRAVRPLSRSGDWVLVAAGGRQLGWVPAEALVTVAE